MCKKPLFAGSRENALAAYKVVEQRNIALSSTIGIIVFLGGLMLAHIVCTVSSDLPCVPGPIAFCLLMASSLFSFYYVYRKLWARVQNRQGMGELAPGMIGIKGAFGQKIGPSYLVTVFSFFGGALVMAVYGLWRGNYADISDRPRSGPLAFMYLVWFLLAVTVLVLYVVAELRLRGLASTRRAGLRSCLQIVLGSACITYVAQGMFQLWGRFDNPLYWLSGDFSDPFTVAGLSVFILYLAFTAIYTLFFGGGERISELVDGLRMKSRIPPRGVRIIVGLAVLIMLAVIIAAVTTGGSGGTP